ncbi:MAG: colicin V production protein [Planctomycetota bacterium]|nr:MAG: colicin V production protein [Planctomycetota bacterium]
MQHYDLLMLAVLGGATLFGFWKGLAWQVASLASLVVSYFMALRFADDLAPRVSEHAPFNKFAAMLIIYAISSAGIWLLFRLVAGFIDQVKLKEFDRQMGALVGFAKGVLICIAITFFAVSLLGDERRDQILASRSGQYIAQVLDKADAVAPPEIKEVIGPYIDQINQRLDPNYRADPQQDLQQLRRLWDQAQQAMPAAPATGWPAGGAASGWPTTTPQQPAAGHPSTPAWPISGNGDRL